MSKLKKGVNMIKTKISSKLSNLVGYDMRLAEINNFHNYIDKLASNLKNMLVIICVKDTIGFAFKEAENNKIKKLGLSKNLVNQHQVPYVAIIWNEKVICEQLGVKNSIINYSTTIKKIKINLDSAPYTAGNVSRIILDGYDFAVNSRGMNFVVVDLRGKRVVDSVCFDTHIAGFKCTRGFVKASESISAQLEVTKSLAALQAEVDGLKRQLSVDRAHNEIKFWNLYKKDSESIKQAKERFFAEIPSADSYSTERKIQIAVTRLLVELDIICRKNNLKYWLDWGTLIGAIRHKGFVPWDDDIDVGMPRADFDKLYELMKDSPNFYIDKILHHPVHEQNVNFLPRLKYRISEEEAPYFLDIFIFDYCDKSGVDTWVNIHNIRNNFVRECKEVIAKHKLPNPSVITGACVTELYQLHNKYIQIIKKQVGVTYEPNNALVWSIDNHTKAIHKQLIYDTEQIIPLREVEFEGRKYFTRNQYDNFLKVNYGDIWTLPNDILSHKHFILSNRQDKILDYILKTYCTEDQMGRYC